MITSKERAKLRSISSKLNSIFQIGKNGITPEITKGIDEYLEVNEIVKINVLSNCLESTKYIATTISERTRSKIVQIVGKKIILYRISKNKRKNDINKLIINKN